ncbi:MAG TPA: DUF3887 domain-containing protein [Chthoniobacteraceae bacterium]|jgi:hypothetical protein|nr:DUF3887 domain-containing protein [Chthoniobacteraceae bacterium]
MPPSFRLILPAIAALIVGVMIGLLIHFHPPRKPGNIPAPAPTPDQAVLEQRGVAFVEMLTAGKFPEATQWFDPTMAAGLSAPALGTEWHQLDIGGKYLGHDAPHLAQEAQYYSVYVPCRWEKNKVDIKVVFNAAGKVSGLWVAPYD